MLYLDIQHEKYFQMSTNKPSFGSAVLKEALDNILKFSFG